MIIPHPIMAAASESTYEPSDAQVALQAVYYRMKRSRCTKRCSQPSREPGPCPRGDGFAGTGRMIYGQSIITPQLCLNSSPSSSHSISPPRGPSEEISQSEYLDTMEWEKFRAAGYHIEPIRDPPDSSGMMDYLQEYGQPAEYFLMEQETNIDALFAIYINGSECIEHSI
ncbi:hypothetical protein BD779DRAFT_249033 [Infundibulicybe gibba]|nr:hypothetical protein BD779DRAFT_249033 [Infundibulicybe gibba]